MADQTESSVHIAAQQPAIMAVIADLPSYPEWTTFSSAEVLEETDDGRPLRARFVLDAGPIKDKQVMRYEWQGDSQVDWFLEEGTALRSLHGTYILTPDADGSGTTVVYRLLVDVSLPMIGMLRRKAEKVIVDTALKGLKERVEGR